VGKSVPTGLSTRGAEPTRTWGPEKHEFVGATRQRKSVFFGTFKALPKQQFRLKHGGRDTIERSWVVNPTRFSTEKPSWTRSASVLDAAKHPRDRALVDRVKSPPAQATAVAGQGGGVDLALHRERYSSKAT
jgi:hypothetical protein